MRAQILEKLATRNSSTGKENAKVIFFEGRILKQICRSAAKEIHILQIPYLVRSDIFCRCVHTSY